VGLPSIWVLMAVSVGGSLFGIAGMLMFIPLMSTCYALFKESVNNRNMQKGRPPVQDTGQSDRAGKPEGSSDKRKGSQSSKKRNQGAGNRQK